APPFPPSVCYTRRTQSPMGTGGLVSTASDYYRFAQMLLNRGELDGVRLLGRKTIELMTADHLPSGVQLFGDPSTGFGLGVSVLKDLGKSQGLGSNGVDGCFDVRHGEEWHSLLDVRDGAHSTLSYLSA